MEGMTKKIKDIIKRNNGYIVKDIKILNETYCVKALSNDQWSLNAISELYGDYYLNSSMVSITEMNKKGYQNKLDSIVKRNKKDGFTYWSICEQNNDKAIGLYGFKRIKNSKEKELELTFMCKIKDIIKPLSEIMIKFLFENFNITQLKAHSLSYNQAAQIIAKQIGMMDCGISNTNDGYIRDSYLIEFVLSRNKYNEIKKINKGKYKLLKFPKQMKPNIIHSYSRYLYQAIQEFKINKDTSRLQYCKKFYKYKKTKYPLICKKEENNKYIILN